MGSDRVSCATCGKEMAYDDSYGFVEQGDEMQPVCSRQCKERFSVPRPDAGRGE